MFEGLRFLVSLDRPLLEILRDLVDILIVAFIVYRALLVLKGTRAMQMGLGFVAFGMLYLLAKYADLATLQNVLSELASAAILIIVVVFQNDIRRALIRVGSKAWLSRGRDQQIKVIEEVVAAAKELARHRTGALICFERDANVLEFVKNDGIQLDSMVTRELLVSLFLPESANKTHDGAVLIRDLRISHAGLFFPMPESTRVADPTLGSRHRAAIGITEETDAVVVAVSEERGTITLVFKDGTMAPNLTEDNLRTALLGLFGRDKTQKQRQPLMKRVFRRSPQTTLISAGVGPADEKKPKSKDDRKHDSKIDLKLPDDDKKDDRQDKSDTETTAQFRPSDKKKRSGGFKAVRPSEAETPAPPRVSIPMPSPKDRKPGDPLPSTPPPPPTSVRPPVTSVSKPMTLTDLPTTLIPPDES